MFSTVTTTVIAAVTIAFLLSLYLIRFECAYKMALIILNYCLLFIFILNEYKGGRVASSTDNVLK